VLVQAQSKLSTLEELYKAYLGPVLQRVQLIASWIYLIRQTEVVDARRNITKSTGIADTCLSFNNVE